MVHGCGNSPEWGRVVQKEKKRHSLSCDFGPCCCNGMAPPTLPSSFLCVHFGWRMRTSYPICGKLTPCISPSWHFAVPPRLTLHCDDHGNPVCEAEAGKPPAQISWDLESNSTPREEVHNDGTVTVVSTFTAHGTNMTSTICTVSHPTGNQSKSIACRPSSKLPFVRLVFQILISLPCTILFLLGRKNSKRYKILQWSPI